MTTRPEISKAELAEKFRAFIDPDFVITDNETIKPYECDGLSMYCEMPLLVLLPETSAQVQRVMRICNEQGVPVVARGAGTGLSAGAMPHKEGVVATSPSVRKWLSTACITARIRRPRLPAPLAATWRKTPVGCTA
jgi:hypothetical protein